MSVVVIVDDGCVRLVWRRWSRRNAGYMRRNDEVVVRLLAHQFWYTANVADEGVFVKSKAPSRLTGKNRYILANNRLRWLSSGVLL